MFSTLHGSSESVLAIKENATHYFQRESAIGYLKLDPDAKQLNGTGGYVKIGKRGNAQWNFSETFNWASPGFDMNDVGFTRLSDFKLNESEITYRKTDPWGPFRFAGINLTQKNVWNYGGIMLNNDVAIRWRSLSIKKRFEMDIKETFNWNTVDTRRLRGGPDLKYTNNFESSISVNTDRAKKVMMRLEYYGRQYLAETSYYNEIRPAAVFRVGNHLKLTTQFNYAWNKDNLQYVATVPLISNAMTSPNKPLYIMGKMNQQTYGITINAQYNLTPDLSIQYYGSPFTSIADFTDFKIATNTLDKKYTNRFQSIPTETLKLQEGIYTSTKDGQLTFKNSNFSFNEIKSNLVIRWEYLPGSTAYLVWEHNRSNRQGTYYPGWANNLDHMFALPANNTIMLKLNYWLGL